MNAHVSLEEALALLELERKPDKLRRLLVGTDGADLLSRARGHARGSVEIQDEAASLADRGISALTLNSEDYPNHLRALQKPPPILFAWGALDLLSESAVGMCGSRNVSGEGLLAARTCGDEVAAHGLVIVSGYAKGVDTETHLAALRSGGRTIIVLAEGISHFRRKRAFDLHDFSPEKVLVISQFAPSLTWNVGAAMTRNSVIAGLGKCLVVIEAAEKGGTLNAGLQAIAMGRPVLALEFTSKETPPGNRLLIERGALPVRSRSHLGAVLQHLSATPPSKPVAASQLSLLS